MGGFHNGFLGGRLFLALAGLSVVVGSLSLTAQAAPAVMERFTTAWGAVSTLELDRELYTLRLDRMEKNAVEERLRRQAEEEKKKIITRRGLSRLTIADHVPPAGKFIGIDLVEMTLSMFEDGKEVATSTILSKGKPGSHWETPSGSYTIRTKEELHFSTIGHVYMPWSMQFFGNFFIHGWPVQMNGLPVPEGYSGGCIRLSTPDSERVFNFAKAGTPIFIYDTDALPDEPTKPLPLAAVDKPELTSEAFLVADLDAGEVLFEKNAGVKHSIASITKFVTAIVANESISYDRMIDIVPPPAGEVDSPAQPFPEGERFVLGDTYYPLLLESSNQVAASIAANYGTERFVKQMNAKALALGMKNTHFADPSGLSSENVSTADDLVLLLTHLREKKRFLLNISGEEKKTIVAQSETPYEIKSIMPFADDKSFIGGKTGTSSSAKEAGAFLFRYGEGEDIRAIAVIVLGSDSRVTDIAALRTWLDRSVAAAAAGGKTVKR